MATRYTAHIKMTRTISEPIQGAVRGTPQSSRRIEQLDITVSASTLDALKQKVTGHISLVDDEDINEPAK